MCCSPPFCPIYKRTPKIFIRFSLDFNPLKAALAATSFDKTFKPIVTHEIHDFLPQDFLQFEFSILVENKSFKITYPSFLGWQDILALVKSWVFSGEKKFKNLTFTTWTLDLQKPDPSSRKKCFSKFFSYGTSDPISLHNH